MKTCFYFFYYKKTLHRLLLVLLIFQGNNLLGKTSKSFHAVDKTISSYANEVVFQEQISGQVTDESGVPLPGASVIEKGTTNGTQTDFDGNFNITVSKGAVLVVSYVGFAPKEVVIESSSVINVVLQEDAAALDEVVVIGYGTQTRAEVTNAVSQLEGPVLKQTPAISTSNALQGQVPGLFVVQGSSAPGFDDSELRFVAQVHLMAMCRF